jgi:hypothetical protein
VDLHAEDSFDVLACDVVSLADGGVDGLHLRIEEGSHPKQRFGSHEGGGAVAMLSKLSLQDSGVLREGKDARAEQESIVGSVGMDHGEKVSLQSELLSESEQGRRERL